MIAKRAAAGLHVSTPTSSATASPTSGLLEAARRATL